MIENAVFGVSLTIVAPFAVLGLASLVRKFGVDAEGSRKLAHVLLCNWILLALAVYRSAWSACILPACFILLNYLSCKKKIFSAIERNEDNTLGTVWYAVSLFLLCLAGYCLNMPWIAACGMLAMGYGDGLAALVGKRWGKLRFPGAHSQKTLEGMFTVMLFSALAVGFACAVYAHDIAPYFALYAALSCAVPAAAIELFTPRGIDNLTLPLGVSFIVFFLSQSTLYWPLFACLSITLLILLIAYYLRAITLSGLFPAILLGTSLFALAGWISFAALLLFFVLGSLVSHIGKNKKSAAVTLHERRGARTFAQVLANGLPSLIFAVFYFFTGFESLLLAVIACFAASTADTFSSEIGMLSIRPPLSILTLKPVQRGISGGFTFLGLFGGALGASFVSILAFPYFGLKGFFAVAIGGFFSSLLDSIFGAALQAKYKLPSNSKVSLLTERKSLDDGAPLILAHGLKWVNNDLVNFISVLVTALILSVIW